LIGSLPILTKFQQHWEKRTPAHGDQPGVKSKLFLAFFALITNFPSTVFGNVIGSDFQNFNPTSNGIDFVTVESSETLRPGILNLGLFANYAINGLPEFEDGQVQRSRRGKIRNSLLSSDFNIGLGLTKNWDIGLNLPSTLAQDVKDKDQSRIQYAAKGQNEVRLNSKLRLIGNRRGGIALSGVISQNLIQDNPMLGDSSGVSYMLQLAGDKTFSHLAVGANIGYRWRTPGEPIDGIPLEPFGNQILASSAISYYFKAIRMKLIGEVYGAFPSNDDPEELQKLQRNAEGLLGIKTLITRNLAFHTGAGTHLNKTAVSPDYRVYAGINYTMGPLWNKKRKFRKRAKPAKPVSGGGISGYEEAFVLDNINFEFDSDFEVMPGAYAVLEKVFERIKSRKIDYQVIVEGHTDSFGTDEYNEELSERRAKTVRRYLIKEFSLEPNRVEAIGFGENNPVTSNGNYQGRLENRRVEIRILFADGVEDASQ
jgi:outer membrane protein OmpA-like peptidoglycan-associated protein